MLLTPKRVAIRRIIPVIHARVRLTNNTSATSVAFDDPCVSSSQRAEGREVRIIFNNLSDSGDGVLLSITTPTIWPAQYIREVNYKIIN